MSTYMKSIGIDTMMLEHGYSESVAEILVGSQDPCGFEEAVFDARRLVSELAGCSICIFSVNPLTVIVDSEGLLKFFRGMVLDTFLSIVRRLSGVNLRLDSEEEFRSESSSRVKSVFLPTGAAETCHRFESKDFERRFAIVEKNGWTKVITSMVQADILRILSSRPAGMQDLVGFFDMPRSTLAYNIGKMIEEGMLRLNAGDDGAGFYSTDYRLFLMPGGSEKHYSGAVLSNRRGYFDGYLGYVAQ